MKVLIRPKKLSGIIDIIPSKSYSHRAIIAASLAKGHSTIRNVLFSNDIKRTIDACRAFGAVIEEHSDFLEIEGSNGVKRINDSINVGESGSTIRFMIPIMMVSDKKMEFDGLNNRVNRPLDTYFRIFSEQNIKFMHPDDKYLPLTTYGSLKPGVYEIEGNVSSQFVTGLLFALPLLKGKSTIKIIGTLESKAYIDLTLDILKLYNINIKNNNYLTFEIEGNQSYKAHDYTIEGDFSQAAFFLSMGALGNDIKLRCMNLNSLQGDKKIINDLKEFGVEISFKNELLFAAGKNLNGAVIDFSQSPDLGPTLSVVAALAKGKSDFINAKRLRIKECDRITCMKEELNKIGAIVSEKTDEMNFIGVKNFSGSLHLESHNDHRIAMALAVASTMCEAPIMIEQAECVKKSYPHFWDDFKKLGGDFDVID